MRAVRLLASAEPLRAWRMRLETTPLKMDVEVLENPSVSFGKQWYQMDDGNFQRRALGMF